MKIFPAEDVREIDQYTIEHEPIRSIDLMERAAGRLVDRFVRLFKVNKKVLIFAGPGNNGGDALAMARMLSERQYNVTVFLVSSSGKLSTDCRQNLERLENNDSIELHRISSSSEFPVIDEHGIIVDGIFGSGLSRKSEGVYRDLIIHINNTGATRVSIDIPSGLFGEDNTGNDSDAIIRADHTFTFQFPFLSFLFASNYPFTGNWHVLDIGLSKDIIRQKDAAYRIIDREEAARYLPRRDKFAHKGTFGHALAVAGSYGMMGAAVMTGKAALRSGAGLVTLHIPGTGYRIVQTSFPEAIVSIDVHERCFSVPPELDKYTAVAIGPGLRMSDESRHGLQTLLKKARCPLLLDADALNMIGEDRSLLELLPKRTVLTPHPREFDRMAGSSRDDWERHQKQIELSKRHQLIIVLKGAFTGISFPDGSYCFNTTGNAGMATGGSGDVLTGIILSLMAQGVSPEHAAIAGVYIHGVAGDLAEEKLGQEAMIAGDIIKQLGNAFKFIKETPFLHEGRTGGVFRK